MKGKMVEGRVSDTTERIWGLKERKGRAQGPWRGLGRERDKVPVAVRGCGLVMGEGGVDSQGGMSQEGQERLERGKGSPARVITVEGGAGDPRALTVAPLSSQALLVATDKRGERGWLGVSCAGER